MNNCSSLDQQILYICSYEYNYFLKKANILGIGLGYKLQNNFYTNKKCIKVFVSNKITSKKLLKRDLVPLYYKGIPTDVVESGIMTTSSLTSKIRPVTGGYSISPTVGSTGGSMACLVKDGRFLNVLSNNHVLCSQDKTPIGAPIIQPGVEDGGRAPMDTIANFTKYIPLKYTTHTSKPENLVDCAIAKVTDNSLVSSKITFIGHIKGVANAKLGQVVQKVGRTTDLTTGKITTLGVTITINFKEGPCLFKDQIALTCMSNKGDSGSLVLDEHNHAIGLLMADSKSYSLCNPINTVLKMLNVSIVTT